MDTPSEQKVTYLSIRIVRIFLTGARVNKYINLFLTSHLIIMDKQRKIVLVLRNEHQNFGGKLTKVGWGFVTLYNIFSYILFNVFNEKKFKTCFILRDCLGEGSRESTK